jgi:hypothetical protein
MLHIYLPFMLIYFGDNFIAAMLINKAYVSKIITRTGIRGNGGSNGICTQFIVFL